MKTIRINFTITEEQIKSILDEYNRAVPDWERYMDYMKEALPDALRQHIVDEITYLTYLYNEELKHESA